MNKKLQVFVSSTYKDLKEERQAAVEAILDAGHIPAGMELFKAGNESQLKTIYKWIDDSDVYMLILGGRYGSIESKSGKSYTQLEYEYALSKKIPVFAVVLSESFLTTKINLLGLSDVTEQNAPDKYQTFKSLVMSKIIRMVDDCKDIKITIHSTLNEFMNEYNLIGWIRASSIKSNRQGASLLQVGDYAFLDLVELFNNRTIPYKIDIESSRITTNTALNTFIYYYDLFCTGVEIFTFAPENHIETNFICEHICPYFMGFNLIERTKICSQRYQISKYGLKFYSLLEINGYIK